MEDLIKNLQNLGLNKTEIKIYLALLELGSASVRKIAQKTDVKRTNIYNFIEGLKAKELLTEIKEGNKSIFIPENPQTLVKKAENNLKNIKSDIPELMSIFNLPGSKPKIKFYQGIGGVKRIYEDTLITNETIYEFSDYEKMFSVIEPEWLWNYPPRRASKKIKAYSIAKYGPWAKKIKAKDKEHLRQTKFVKNSQFDTEINIYGNKVAMISFRRPYAGVIIEDVAIANTMRTIWKGWWENLN